MNIKYKHVDKFDVIEFWIWHGYATFCFTLVILFLLVPVVGLTISHGNGYTGDIRFPFWLIIVFPVFWIYRCYVGMKEVRRIKSSIKSSMILCALDAD